MKKSQKVILSTVFMAAVATMQVNAQDVHVSMNEQAPVADTMSPAPSQEIVYVQPRRPFFFRIFVGWWYRPWHSAGSHHPRGNQHGNQITMNAVEPRTSNRPTTQATAQNTTGHKNGFGNTMRETAAPAHS